MKNNKIILTVFILTLLGTMLVAQSYPLPSLSPYDLAVWTINGGFIASGTAEPTAATEEGRLYVDTATPTKPILYRYTDGDWAVISGGASKHSELEELDYDSSGHTGFASAQDLASFTFGQLNETPTTLAGYGIVDAATEIGLAAHIASQTDPHGAEMTVTESITIGTGAPTAYIENVDGNELNLVASTTKVMGKLAIYDVPEYANNSAALTGGMLEGEVFRTGNTLKIVTGVPVEPIMTNLIAWYDAADESTIIEATAVGRVSQWRDKSGNGYHASQATASWQPVTGANTLNGHNVVNFALQRLIAAGAAAPTQDYTLYIVVSIPKNPNHISQIIDLSESAGNTPTLITLDDNTTGNLKHTWGVSYLQTPNYAFTYSTPHCIVAKYNGTTRSLKLDSTEYTDTVSPITYSAGTGIGIGTTSKTGFAQGIETGGYIAEILIYHTAHSVDEVSENQSYLNAKWGL